jgi:hypothetical protein
MFINTKIISIIVFLNTNFKILYPKLVISCFFRFFAISNN